MDPQREASVAIRKQIHYVINNFLDDELETLAVYASKRYLSESTLVASFSWQTINMSQTIHIIILKRQALIKVTC